MKKILTLTAFLAMLIPAVLSAQDTASDKVTITREKNVYTNPSDNEFMGKVGAGYANGPGEFGLDVSLNYIYNLDPVFVFGLEGDFFWVSWSNKLGDIKGKGDVNATLKAETNLYTFPLFANAQIRFPFLRNKIYVEPSITGGLGYAFMILDYSSNTDDGTDFYSGFAWQVYASLARKLHENSAVDFILDLGYRGMKPDRDNEEINMSGPIARLGVRLYM